MFKTRFIVSTIISLIFLVFLSFAELNFNYSSIIAFIVLMILMIILDPKFIEKQKEKERMRREQREYENKIKREEYVREKGRLSARKDFREESEPLSTGFDGPSIFDEPSFKRKRRY